jgi:soluble cytochrome b562
MLIRKKSLGLLLLSGLMLAAVPAGTVRAADETPLAKAMEEMQDELKKLRKSVKAPTENAASLASLDKLQAATVASKAMVPAKAAKMPEAEKAKFVAAYRKDMALLLEHLCKIEVAVADGDNAKAEELFKGIKKLEDDGHEKYTDE